MNVGYRDQDETVVDPHRPLRRTGTGHSTESTRHPARTLRPSRELSTGGARGVIGAGPLFHCHVLRVLAGSLHTAKAADFANLPRAHVGPLLERLVNGTTLGYLKQSQPLFGRQFAV